ncbi:MAG: hypothetical protein ABR987_05695 [Terracidiphilus sp.]|jgi:hypothetical protein
MQITLGLVALALGVAVFVWFLHRPKKMSSGPVEALFSQSPTCGFAVATVDEVGAEPYAYIYVNSDGSARELHTDEKLYLETPFQPGDGGRPYVKGSYAQKNGWGEIIGFMRRSKLPQGAQIAPAPRENPVKPLTREDQMRFLREKGMDIMENSDGSFTARKKKS